MPLALLALTISAFAIGTTEFVIVGLVPTIANQLAISLPSAGLLVSIYALGVAVGAPVLTALTGRFPRKQLLVALMVLFTAGNILAWQAPDYAGHRSAVDRPCTRGILLDWFYYCNQPGTQRESGIRHCDHVRWVDRCTRYGRTVGHVYRTTLRLA